MIALSARAAQLANELDIERRASDDGLRNIPPAAAVAPSGAEAEIVARGKQAASEFLDDARAWATQTDELVRRLAEQTASCRDAVSQATARAASAGSQYADSHRRAAAQFEKCQAEYNEFRREAGLQRDAANPSKAVAVMWLLSIIIVEGAFNSFVYAETSELGLAGGFYVAFVIGLCNVAFAFIGAFASMRYLFHADPLKKLFGLAGAAATVAVCGTILLFAALYRVGLGLQLQAERAGGPPIDGWQLALEALQEGKPGVALATFDSAILLAVGIICMLLGIWKGLYFDDPYPGYGEVGRALADARDDLEDAQEIRAEAEDDGGSRLSSELLRRAEELRQLSRTTQADCSQLRGRMRNLATLQDDWVAELRTLVKKYRETNTGKRVAAAPQYFLEEHPGSGLLDHLAGEIAEIQAAPDYAGWQQAAAEADRQADAAAAAARGLAANVPAG